LSNLTLDHFVAMKREFMATLPPPMLALKCNAATEALVRRMIADAQPASPLDLYQRPPVYWDNSLPTGKVLVAETREIADLWRLQEQLKWWQWRREEVGHLISVLRQRVAALGGA
jgi:hypothetical protein